MKIRTQICLDAAAIQYSSEITSAKKLGNNIKKDSLKIIIKKLKEKFNLSDDTKIDRETICSRYCKGNLT